MKLNVKCRTGETRVIDGESGRTLMESIKDSGIDELLALCGGCCSCSTCHVYIDELEASSLPAMASDEDDLLDSSSFRQPTSRLSCQVVLDQHMDGLHVTIAEQD